jgi:hypothetical protein
MALAVAEVESKGSSVGEGGLLRDVGGGFAMLIVVAASGLGPEVLEWDWW